MNIGSILVAKGLVTAEDVERAIANQQVHGGRLGDNLVALGICSMEEIDAVLTDAPQAPATIEDTGVDPTVLLELMIKGIYSESLETPSQLVAALKLSNKIVTQLLQVAGERKLVEAMASAAGGGGLRKELRYGLTRAGREYAIDALNRSQYFGPAPVPLAKYQERILRQRVTNEVVTRAQLDEAFRDLVMPDRFVSRLGPAVNSGAAVLIYGPPGNGKTTVAEIVGNVFQNIIYIPHCVDIDGEIMKVFDPSVHRVVEQTMTEQGPASLRRNPIDPRWVACYRPMVITGGELTIEMLDLKYNAVAKYYEAPLHIKALNGTFLIDDFGRQRATPEEILNRWIVPLNSRIDYLSLHTGKSFMIPFDEMVIFSTNMHPDDLMDPAFQRRISYKLETVEPAEELFLDVFYKMAQSRGLELTEEVFMKVLNGVRANGAPLAYFQPKFIVEQVLASCKFEGIEPQFTPQNVDDALSNLFVSSTYEKAQGVATNSSPQANHQGLQLMSA
jgi:predicted ATPase with chaperone activity